MTASGFRAFFPNSTCPPPPPPPGAASHLQHLIPNMRFLAHKLENPNFFPNFPSQHQSEGSPSTAPQSCQSDRDEDEGNEVSTSSSYVRSASTASNMTCENGQNNLVDHGADSGTSFTRESFSFPISWTLVIISQFCFVFFLTVNSLAFAIRLENVNLANSWHAKQ